MEPMTKGVLSFCIPSGATKLLPSPDTLPPQSPGFAGFAFSFSSCARMPTFSLYAASFPDS